MDKDVAYFMAQTTQLKERVKKVIFFRINQQKSSKTPIRSWGIVNKYS